jgi:hypothetical protein
MPGYDSLLELARREHALVAAGRFDELEALTAERAALVAALPAQAPRHARPLLEATLAVVDETARELEAGLARMRRDLGGLAVHRRVASSYVAAPGASLVDVAG